MFKAGARAGGDTVLALADDIHKVSKLAIGSKEGAGFAVLRAMFPTTADVIERNAQRIEKLEEELFPTLPEDGQLYEADVVNPILLDENGTSGYHCVINMRPPFHFNVISDHPKGDEDHPTTLVVRCVEREDQAWVIDEGGYDRNIQRYI